MRVLVLLISLFCATSLSFDSDASCLDSGAMLIGFDWWGGMIGRPQNCVSEISCMDKICQISNTKYVVWVAVIPCLQRSRLNWEIFSHVIPVQHENTQELSQILQNNNCWAHGALFIGYDFNNTTVEYDLCLSQDTCWEILCNITAIPNVSYVEVMPFL